MAMTCSYALALLFFCGIAAQAAVERVTVSQTAGYVPSVRAYIDVRGDNDADVAELAPAQLSVRVGGTVVPVSGLEPFGKSGEGVALVFAVDISRSLRPAVFRDMREAMAKWTDSLGKNDRAAIVMFGDSTRVLQQFTADKAVLRKAIASLEPKDSRTQFLAGIVEAIRLSRRLDNDLPARRAIVVMSDGKDEGSGITAEDVIENLRVDRVPMYAIGASSLPAAEKTQYFAILHRLALRSGGTFQELSADDPAAAYTKVRKRIERVWVAKLDCGKCPADGRSYPIAVAVSQQGGEVVDKAEITLTAAAPLSATPAQKSGTPSKGQPAAPEVWWKRITWWVYAAGSVALLAMIAGAVVYRRRRGGTEHDTMPRIDELPTLSTTPGSDSTRFTFTGGTTKLPVTATAAATATAAPTSSGAAGLVIELTARNRGDRKQYVGRLVDHIIIGRSESAGLRVPDEEISGQHCRIDLVDGRLVVVADLNSTNGTAVNGVPVKGRQRLESGDLISLGRAEFRFDVQERK